MKQRMGALSEKNKRSENHILLRLVCSFAIAYYGLSGLVLLVALVFNEFITGLSMQYLPELGLTRLQIILFLLAGLMMNLGAVYGITLVLKKKIIGAVVFVLSSFLIMGYQFILSGTEGWQKYAVESGLLLLFLIFLSFGFKKMQPLED